MLNETFRKAKAMTFPRTVLAGHRVLDRTPAVMHELGIGKRIMVVTGRATMRVAAGRVIRLLERNGFNTAVFVTGDATILNFEEAARFAASFVPDAIVGVGGGSKIDLAKLASRKVGCNFISIPTSASHDGISSPRASIKDGALPLSVEASTPLAIIADTQIIAKAPYRLLASGCADVISNSTALLDWELASRKGRDVFSTTAFTLARYAADTVMKNASRISRYDETAVWLAVRPIIASGLAMGAAGSSRPASGSEHLFSHALDTLHRGQSLHGEQCGVGAIMMMALHGGDWRSIRKALERLRCPVTAEEMGLSDDDIVSALVRARSIRRDRYTILDARKLNVSSARRLARRTGVIH